jgi:hypothetical protein
VQAGRRSRDLRRIARRSVISRDRPKSVRASAADDTTRKAQRDHAVVAPDVTEVRAPLRWAAVRFARMGESPPVPARGVRIAAGPLFVVEPDPTARSGGQQSATVAKVRHRRIASSSGDKGDFHASDPPLHGRRLGRRGHREASPGGSRRVPGDHSVTSRPNRRDRCITSVARSFDRAVSLGHPPPLSFMGSSPSARWTPDPFRRRRRSVTRVPFAVAPGSGACPSNRRRVQAARACSISKRTSGRAPAPRRTAPNSSACS